MLQACACRYADRAKAIQLKARRNESRTEVGKLKEEVRRLQPCVTSLRQPATACISLR